MNHSQPHVQVIIHARWTSAVASPPLTDAVWERLPSYVMRYAQSLCVTGHAVGGGSDSLNLLFDLPSDQTLEAVIRELQQATGRFVNEVLGLTEFRWDANLEAQSVSAAEIEEWITAINTQGTVGDLGSARQAWLPTSAAEADDMPRWLREVMPTTDGDEA